MQEKQIFFAGAGSMNVLEKGGFQDLMERAVEHATKRAGEMGREVQDNMDR